MSRHWVRGSSQVGDWSAGLTLPPLFVWRASVPKCYLYPLWKNNWFSIALSVDLSVTVIQPCLMDRGLNLVHGERRKVFPVFPGSEHVTDQRVLNNPLLLLPLYTAYRCRTVHENMPTSALCFSLIIDTSLIRVTKTAMKPVLIVDCWSTMEL